MAKLPSLEEAWITKRIIGLVADDLNVTPREIRRTLKRLGEVETGIRQRDMKGKVQYRAADVASHSFTMESFDSLSDDESSLAMSIGWSLTKLLDPEAIAEAQCIAMEAFIALGFNRQAPREQIWFHDTVFEAVLKEIGDVAAHPSSTRTLMLNNLAYLEAFAGCDAPGAPKAVRNLRVKSVVGALFLNVQDLVVLGEDEEALAWLRQKIREFGPKSMLLMELIAEALRHLYPNSESDAISA